MYNHPKLTYRSDTTACTYEMMQRDGAFVIQVLQFDVVQEESPEIPYLAPWRKSIDLFFDMVTSHINTGQWR